jgi:hypothetical protein
MHGNEADGRRGDNESRISRSAWVRCG